MVLGGESYEGEVSVSVAPIRGIPTYLVPRFKGCLNLLIATVARSGSPVISAVIWALIEYLIQV